MSPCASGRVAARTTIPTLAAFKEGRRATGSALPFRNGRKRQPCGFTPNESDRMRRRFTCAGARRVLRHTENLIVRKPVVKNAGFLAGSTGGASATVRAVADQSAHCERMSQDFSHIWRPTTINFSAKHLQQLRTALRSRTM